jgi:hypothetical protein
MLADRKMNKELRSLRIIHGSLLAHCIVFSALVIYVVTQMPRTEIPDYKFAGTLLIPLIGITVIGGFIIKPIYRRRLKNIQETMPLSERILIYKSAIILIWSGIEGVILSALIVYLVTSVYYMLIIGAFLILVLIYLYPSDRRITEALKLSRSDKESQL